MASEPAGDAGRGLGFWLCAAWVFGCAAYYYVHFTSVFIHKNDSALRRAFPNVAETFLSRPSAR